jgi:sulfite oxidase
MMQFVLKLRTGIGPQCRAMLDMPNISSVGFPCSGSTAVLSSSGTTEVPGCAVPQGAHDPVVRIQVLGDEGKTWVDAHRDGGEDTSLRAWISWNATTKMEKTQRPNNVR